jgi:hypothetical protein
MKKNPKIDTQPKIVVSKWLERMWEIEEEHPFLIGSSLSSKGWVPEPARKSAARKPVAAKTKAAARKGRAAVAK